MKATFCHMLLVVFCCGILVGTASYRDKDSTVDWRDFVKFVDEVISQTQEEKQYQNQEPEGKGGLYREYDPFKRDRGLNPNEFLTKSGSKTEELVDDFIYNVLADSTVDKSKSASPQESILSDSEYDDIAQALQSEDGRQQLLAVAYLEDVIDSFKQNSQEKEIPDGDVNIYFPRERNKDSIGRDGLEPTGKIEDIETSKVANHAKDSNLDFSDVYYLEEGDSRTNDGKKERGQVVDEKSEAENERDNGEKHGSEIAEPLPSSDENELRSLLIDMAKADRTDVAKDGQSAETTADHITIELQFPGISVDQDDTYLCTAAKIYDFAASHNKSIYITKYVPHANQTVAHHMLLYGCSIPGISHPGAVWNCGGTMDGTKKGKFPLATICGDGQSTILWAWAKDAPAFTLPKGIGFKIGAKTHTQYLVLQVHYKSARVFRGGMKDHSGVTILATDERQPLLAGVYLLASSMGTVRPHETKNFDIVCRYSQPFSIHPFAFRTHTHALGIEVIGFRIRDQEWTLIGEKNPQLPEAFYPVSTKNMTIRYGDWLAARCVMRNFRNVPTSIGWKHTSEMCNFYIMFWVNSKYENQLDSWTKSCGMGFPWVHWSSLPGYKI